MRTLLLLFSIGAIMATVVEQAPGQEKKEEKYPEKLTVRVWDKQGKKFLNPQEVDARRMEIKDKTYFVIPNKQLASNTTPVKGSEVTDSKGVTWISETDAAGGTNGECRVAVSKKP